MEINVLLHSFLYFLEKNGILYDTNGIKRIADNALVHNLNDSSE